MSVNDLQSMVLLCAGQKLEYSHHSEKHGTFFGFEQTVILSQGNPNVPVIGEVSEARAAFFGQRRVLVPSSIADQL